MRKVFLYIFLCIVCIDLAAQNAMQDKLKVYTFLHTECPISQQSVATLNLLVANYPTVEFISVFTRWDSPTQIRQFKKKYKLASYIIHDRNHRQLKKLGATTTPQVFVVATNSTFIYKGAIDNNYISLGNKRQSGFESYLNNALHSYFAGKVITPYETQAIGCKIESINNYEKR